MTVNNYWHMQMHPTDELEKFSGYFVQTAFFQTEQRYQPGKTAF